MTTSSNNCDGLKSPNQITSRRAMLQANESFVIRNYLEAVRKKHQEDSDYTKWDLTVSKEQIIIIIIKLFYFLFLFFVAFFFSFLKIPLPKLPVPDLKLSIEKYLRCMKSVLSEEASRKTEQYADEFIKERGVGEQLQEILK